MTVTYDARTVGPADFVAAIVELGYQAQPLSPGKSTKPAFEHGTTLVVPPDSPRFFVDAISRARAAERPLVIDFQADWCVACIRLKRETLAHPDVVKALRSVVFVEVDLDKYPALGDAYGITSIPVVLFVNASGTIVDRLKNFEPPPAFIDRVQRIAGPESRFDAQD